MAAQTQMTAAQQAAMIQQQNANARSVLLQNALDTWQPIFAQTFATPNPGQIYTIPLRQVGFVKRLVVEIQMAVRQGASETQTLTQFGPANILSNVSFFDLSNYQRINTTGWHLFMIASVKQRYNIANSASVFGTAYTNDSPVNAKSNFAVIKAPSSLTTVQTISMFYEIPITYSDYDLRGGIYASVVSATMNLQLTLNPNFWVATGADATLAVYQSSTTQLGVINSLSLTVHQNFLDQIPQTQQGPVLPQLDMSYIYLLNQTSFGALSAGQDYPIQYANFRSFLSTCVIYDNAGTLNAGTDINYFALQTANITNIFKYDPYVVALKTRQFINNDWPLGTYYFDYRYRPVNTQMYGNMQLVVNPSVVTSAASTLLVAFEAIAQANQVIVAGSLA